MSRGTRFRVSALWASRNPTRVAGNLLLAWLLAVIFLVAILLPAYPTSKSGWLGLVGLGPPALLVFCWGYERLERKPVLWRVTALLLWVTAGAATAILIYHCAA